MKQHKFYENEDGWIHLTTEDDEALFPCPICRPSYLTYKPVIGDASKICFNANTDMCNYCYEPCCELASGEKHRKR